MFHESDVRLEIQTILDDEPSMDVRDAMYGLAENLGVRLEPREFNVIGSLMPSGAKSVGLEEVSLYEKVTDTFGTGWGGKEVMITVTEVM